MIPNGNGGYICTNDKCKNEAGAGDKKETFTTKSNNKQITVLGDDVATMTKTRVICPNCKHTEAYYTIRQTRAADEPETMIYRCCKCSHSWREY